MKFLRHQWVKDLGLFLALFPWVVAPGVWVYQKLSLSDAIAVAYPVCEYLPFLSSPNTQFEPGLLGINIYAVKPVRDAQIRFSDIFIVTKWGMYSNGLTETAREEFVTKLPTGELPDNFITPTLPTLPPDSSTTLNAVGFMPPTYEHCFERGSDWFEVIALEGQVYHADPSFRNLREMPSFIIDKPLLWIIGAYALVFITFTIIYRKRLTRKDL